MPSMAEIIRSASLYHDFVRRFIEPGSYDEELRAVLNQEARAIVFKTKAKKENRHASEEENRELKTFTELARVRKKARIYKVAMNVSMHYEKKMLLIEVQNSAPILPEDMQKINERRKTFKEYADRGEEALFFVENMASSTAGAGLGYGTIDASLRDMGLNPEESLTIISTSNTTIMLSIEFDQLK